MAWLRETKRELSWAFVAGFFDGEGCVDCRWQSSGSHKAGRNFRWRVKFYQNSRELLDEIQDFLARRGISSAVEVHSRPDRVAKGHAGSYALAVNGFRNTVTFLTKVEPWVRIKHDEVMDALIEAELKIEEVKARLASGETNRGNGIRAYLPEGRN